MLLVKFILAISGRDIKSGSSLDRCAAVFRGSNKCVSVQGVWRVKGGSYFGTVLTEMGPNPRRMQIELSTHIQKHAHTHEHFQVCTHICEKVPGSC